MPYSSLLAAAVWPRAGRRGDAGHAGSPLRFCTGARPTVLAVLDVHDELVQDIAGGDDADPRARRFVVSFTVTASLRGSASRPNAGGGPWRFGRDRQPRAGRRSLRIAWRRLLRCRPGRFRGALVGERKRWACAHSSACFAARWDRRERRGFGAERCDGWCFQIRGFRWWLHGHVLSLWWARHRRSSVSPTYRARARLTTPASGRSSTAAQLRARSRRSSGSRRVIDGLLPGRSGVSVVILQL